MRRSAAPSQHGPPSKRTKFISPFLSRLSENVARKERTTADVLNLITKCKPQQERVSALASPVELSDKASTKNSKSNCHLGTEDVLLASGNASTEWKDPLQPLSNTKENLSGSNDVHLDYISSCDQNIQQEKLHYESPQLARYQPTVKHLKPATFTNHNTDVVHNNSDSLVVKKSPPLERKNIRGGQSELGSCYYNVMWCKLSKKKHKTWQGDAVMITKGRTVILVDTEGKEIGRSSGYNKKELETLEEGQNLVIGGKEIEVMSVLSEEDYKSGKCFTDGLTMATQQKPELAINMKRTGIRQPFKRPQKSGCETEGLQAPDIMQAIRPRHDINAPNALVLPRPSQSHEWQYNLDKAPVVDVVVDPYISKHLRPHQRAGVVFLYECIMGMKNFTGNGAILADEMGLGKTLQCITLIWTLLRQGPYGGRPVVKRAIVITPGSLVKNWLREFKKWLGTERLKVFAVSQNTKIQEFVNSPNCPVLIISYEMFVRCIDVIQTLKFDLIVCDEGHRLKNTSIKTTTLVNSLASRHRIVLTGTPVQNDLQELFSIVDFTNPGVLGTASAFRHVFEEPIITSRKPDASDEEKLLGETRAAELNRITGMFILRRTSDINNSYLPPKVDMVLFCQPSTLQVMLYQKLLTSQAVKSCLYTKDVAQHLTCISALRKLCNHPQLLYNKAKETSSNCHDSTSLIKEASESDLYQGLYALYPSGYDVATADTEGSGKLMVLSQLLEAFYGAQPQERVVLVSNYTQTLDIIENLCKVCGYQWLRLDGQTPVAKRQQLVERFNNHYSNDFLFLLSSKAGGTGLNLIGASRLILYDIDWNPANDLQAMARVWRDGQRRKVYIYRLLTTGSIEEKMYQRQITKQGLSGVVVDAKTTTTSNQVQFSQDELRDLFKLEQSTHCTTHDMLGCDCQGQEQLNIREDVHQLEQPERRCQIGQISKKNQKNVCMDELFQWQHLAGPSPSLDIDPVLSEVALANLSFVFYCQSNTVLKSDPTMDEI